MNLKIITIVLVVSLLFLTGVLIFAFQRSQTLIQPTENTTSSSTTPGDTVGEIEADLDSVTLDETEADIESLEMETANF